MRDLMRGGSALKEATCDLMRVMCVTLLCDMSTPCLERFAAEQACICRMLVQVCVVTFFCRYGA